jgi:hypothetical protein
MTLSKDKRNKYRTLAIVLLIVAVGSFVGGFYNGQVINKNNIKLINGTLNSFYFKDMGRQRYDYMIYLNETNKPFQISATLVDYFNKNGFEQSMKSNDSICCSYLEIPGIIFKDRNVLLSIDSNNERFMLLDDSFDKLKSESGFLKYVSPISLFLGIVILIGLRKNDKNSC